MQGSERLLTAKVNTVSSAHLPAWRDYNQKVRTSGAMGVWHETYVVKPGSYENIYVNMPAFGLGRVALQHGSHAPVGANRDHARARLAG